jgi:hypothetical protein
MTVRQKITLAVGWASALAVLAVILAATVSANGRVGQFVRQTAGPYEIALGTIPDSPAVGQLHLTMTVRDTAAESFVLDAEITVTGVGPDGDAVEIGPLDARNSPTSLDFYEVNTSVDRVGTWVFTVLVSGEPGEGSADFLIKVRTASTVYRIFTWVTVMVFFALVGLGLFPYLRRRMRRRLS